MKRARTTIGIVVVGLAVASVIAAFLHPEPLDVARTACAERGNPAASLALSGFRRTGQLFDLHETVEFSEPGAKPAKRVVVDLRQPAYFLPWQVVDVREDRP